MLEMKIVLPAVLARGVVRSPNGVAGESARRRAITISPRDGAVAVLDPVPGRAPQPTGALPSASV
jgi:hypothetical protein